MITAIICDSSDEWLGLTMGDYQIANFVAIKVNNHYLIKKDRANPVSDQQADWKEVCDRIEANLEY